MLNGETELLANGQGVEFAQIMPFVKQWKKEGVFQEHVKLHGIEYMMTCYSFKLGESEDFLQMVSMMSYKDILQQASHQNRVGFLIFAGSALLSVGLIFCFPGLSAPE